MEKIHIYLCVLFTGCLVDVSLTSLDITVPATLNGQVTLPCRLPMDRTASVRWFSEKDGWLTSGTRVYKHNGNIAVVKPAPDEWNLRIRRVTTSFEDIYTCKTDRGVLISSVKLVIQTPGWNIDEQKPSATRITFTETSQAPPTRVKAPEPEMMGHHGQQNIQECTAENRWASIDQRLDDIEKVQKEILEKVGAIYEKLASTPRQESQLQPENLLAIPISSNEIEVAWDSPKKAITLFKLYYNDSRTCTQNIVTLLPDVTKYKLVDLIPGTSYSIQLEAQSNEEVTRTDIVQTRTPEFIPREPRRVKAQPESSGIMSVKWRPPQSDRSNGIIRGYNVYYEEIDESNEPIQGTEKVERVDDGKSNSMLIVDLLPDKRYRVSVAAFTRKGEGDRSRYRRISTAVPSEPKLIVEMEQETQRALVIWSKPNVTNGEIKGYRLHWGMQGDILYPVFFNYTDFAWKTPVLEQNVIYEFRLEARNELDRGKTATDFVHVCIKVSVPGSAPTKAPGSAPTKVKARAVNRNKIRLEWKEPKLSNGIIEGYKIIYTANPEFPIAFWHEENVIGETMTTTLSGLLPNTTYAIAVKAFSSGGMGPFSALVKVFTGNIETDAVPHPPRNVKAYATSPNQIDVSWDPPENINSNIKYHYNIYISGTLNTKQGKIVTTGRTFHSLTDLAPDTFYSIQVASQSSTGFEVKSTAVEAKTNA